MRASQSVFHSSKLLLVPFSSSDMTDLRIKSNAARVASARRYHGVRSRSSYKSCIVLRFSHSGFSECMAPSRPRASTESQSSGYSGMEGRERERVGSGKCSEVIDIESKKKKRMMIPANEDKAARNDEDCTEGKGQRRRHDHDVERKSSHTSTHTSRVATHGPCGPTVTSIAAGERGPIAS